MKIDIGKVKDQQEYLQKIITNQEEIISELEIAVRGVINLKDFTGSTADEIKNYFSSMHIEVINTIKIMLMEIKIKLYNYVQGFLSEVDGSSNAIIDKDYIESVEKSLDEISSELSDGASTSSAILSRANKYVQGGTDYYSKITVGYNSSKKKSESIKKSFQTFENNHKNDMNDIISAIDSLNSIIQRMTNVQMSTTVSIDIGDCLNSKDLEQIREYQITASSEVVNMEEDTIGQYVGMLADMMIPIGALGTSVGEIRNTEDIRKLYKAGVKFELTKNNNGEMIYKLITDEKNIPAIRNKLQALGIDNLTRKNISDMIRDGLTVVNKDGHKVSSKIVKQLESLTGFRGDFDDISKAANISPSTATKTIKNIDMFGKIVTVGVNAYENTYNPMTGKHELSGEAVWGAATDTAVDLGIDWAIVTGSAALGQALIPIPGVGALVGTVVGLGASIFLANFEFGEPPESVYDRIKFSVKDISNLVGNTLAKVFW